MNRGLRSTMQGVLVRTYRVLALVAALGVLVSVGLLLQGRAHAETSYSDNYSVTEGQFGSGSLLEGCSASYCAQGSLGDTVVGRGSSENYSAQFGFNSSTEPVLEVITEANNQDLGVLDVASTAVQQTTVKVRTYLSDGYVMQITGNTPHMGTYHLVSMLGSDVSMPGTEQFGINLVDNSSPHIGANPVTVPDGVTDTSVVMEGYDTPNNFKYLNGDVVVQNPYSRGETDYTVSMIVNISNTTPGGYYTGSFSAVVTPTF